MSLMVLYSLKILQGISLSMIIGNSPPQSPGVDPAPYDSRLLEEEDRASSPGFFSDDDDVDCLDGGKYSPLRSASSVESDESESESDDCSGDETPRKVRRLTASVENGDFHPDYTPSPTRQRVLEEGLDALGSSDLSSPKKRECCQRLAESLVTAAGVRVSPKKPLTPKREGELARAARDGDRWFRNALPHVVRLHGSKERESLVVGSQITNWGHIEEPDEKGGFHFCPPGHALRGDLRGFCINQETGVFSAVFKGVNGKDKRSTFFPEYFADLADLKACLDKAIVVFEKTGSKLLLVEKEGNPPFYAQSYTRGGGVLVISVFPIFFFGDLTDEGVAVLEIAGQIYTRDDLLTLIKDNQLIPVFKKVHRVHVYDVAAHLKIPQVPQGIFIQMKCEPFNVDA